MVGLSFGGGASYILKYVRVPEGTSSKSSSGPSHSLPGVFMAWPREMHLLEAWFPAGGAAERRLHQEGTNIGRG